jgi:hypothetical protein
LFGSTGAEHSQNAGPLTRHAELEFGLVADAASNR